MGIWDQFGKRVMKEREKSRMASKCVHGCYKVEMLKIFPELWTWEKMGEDGNFRHGHDKYLCLERSPRHQCLYITFTILVIYCYIRNTNLES